MKLLTICSLLCLLLVASAKNAQEWKSRVVYQILTDRFAKTDGDTSPCPDLSKYCGGTFKGILNNLDYIQGLGFNAIWISPIVQNMENGYHGYWAKNLYEINEHFGSAQDLKDLINACHERDIWVMVDVIANHMGYAPNDDLSQITPFNDKSHYNEPLDSTKIDDNDEVAVQKAWLHGLPDLNQDNEFVRKTLSEWVADTIQTYNIDGIRLDAVRHVKEDFWKEFSKAAGVFTIGEDFDTDMSKIAHFQECVDSLLNFPFQATMRFVFQKGGSMNSIESYYGDVSSVTKDLSVFGNFIDNHDMPRFLYNNGNVPGFKAALAFSICSFGIPTVYYGSEQGYGGGPDPENREVLWPSMNREHEIYKFLKVVNEFRKDTQFYNQEQVQRYADDNFYAFTRGEHLFAFTNSRDHQERLISYHSYPEGTKLCNILFSGDCVEVKDGKFPVILINGEVKIFTPADKDKQNEKQSQASGNAEQIKAGVGQATSQ